MLEEAFFAAAEFVALLVGNWHGGLVLDKAVPEVFDKLKEFGAAKFEERGEFGVHDGNVMRLMTGFNGVCFR